jgi:hypothetical protein
VGGALNATAPSVQLTFASGAAAGTTVMAVGTTLNATTGTLEVRTLLLLHWRQNQKRDTVRSVCSVPQRTCLWIACRGERQALSLVTSALHICMVAQRECDSVDAWLVAAAGDARGDRHHLGSGAAGRVRRIIDPSAVGCSGRAGGHGAAAGVAGARGLA